jgi:superfamily II DNA or RNA helicase
MSNTILDYNSSYRKGKILTDELTFEKVRSCFSEPVENIQRIRERSGNDNIPDTSYAIQKTGMFDFGLSKDVIKFLNDNGIEFSTTESFSDRLNSSYIIGEIFDDLNYKHRYYGLETLQSSLESGCGTVVWATGAGKSLMQASLIENVWRASDKDKFKCLLIVPGLGLVSQLLDNFSEYGVNFTYSGWTGNMKLKDTNVVICNTENFCSKFDSNQKWISEIDLLVVDECHKVTSTNIVSKKLQKIKTPHKFGFTGTIPKSKMDEWKIIGTFGSKIYEKNSKELRDEEFLTDVCVKVIRLHHKNPPRMDYKSELSYIYNSSYRNSIIQKVTSRLTNNILILVNHIEHGENLLDALQKAENKQVFFVHGGISVDERQSIIDKMEKNNNIICVAMSSIFSTGINVKNLHYVLFVAGGKSFIRIIQSIGRGLRLHDSKDKFTVIDICDNLKYSQNHLDKRLEFYAEQQIDVKHTNINLC